jgi:hypothetical protein
MDRPQAGSYLQANSSDIGRYQQSKNQLTLVPVLWGDDWRRASLASAVNEGSRSLQAAVGFFANPRGVAWRIQSSEPCSLPTGAFNPTAA